MTESLPKDGDGAGVRFPPPIIYAVFCGAGLTLDEFWPQLPLEWRFVSSAGWALIAAAFLLMTICVVYMRRARTTIRPDRPTDAIVSGGPFAYSRNPIYIGWLILYFGVALVWGGGYTLILAIPCAAVIHRYAIMREERYLERTFGTAYTDYTARVRRYL